MVAGHGNDGIDVVRLHLHGLHWVFRRREHTQIGQHRQEAGRQKGRVHPIDLTGHFRQIAGRRMVRDEQRRITKLQTQIEQDDVFIFLRGKDVSKIGGDKSRAAAPLAGDECQYLACLVAHALHRELFLDTGNRRLQRLTRDGRWEHLPDAGAHGAEQQLRLLLGGKQDQRDAGMAQIQPRKKCELMLIVAGGFEDQHIRAMLVRHGPQRLDTAVNNLDAAPLF